MRQNTDLIDILHLHDPTWTYLTPMTLRPSHHTNLAPILTPGILPFMSSLKDILPENIPGLYMILLLIQSTMTFLLINGIVSLPLVVFNVHSTSKLFFLHEAEVVVGRFVHYDSLRC